MTTEQAWTFGFCTLFASVTLLITVCARRGFKSAVDFYAGGRSFGSTQSALALAGDFLSAVSFLGIAGMVALNGYDGFLYTTGFFAAWLVVLPLSQLVRNTGRFTIADIPAFRMRRTRVRLACAISTATVSSCFLLAQMVGAGALITLMLGVDQSGSLLGMGPTGTRTAAIVAVGVATIGYVVHGGMKAATRLQIVKAVVLLAAIGFLTVAVLAVFTFNVSDLLQAAADASGEGRAFLEPGLRFGRDVPGDPGQTLVNKLDLVSLLLGLVLGAAALPHVLIRLYTVPDGRAARSSVNRAIVLIGGFCLMTLLLGFGAAALVGPERITAQDPSGNTALPQLAYEIGVRAAGPIGGSVLLAFVCVIALAAILAVIASLALASSSSLAHDFFGHILMGGRSKESQEVAVARWVTAITGVLAILLAVFARNLNVAFLIGLVFAVAASANLPVMVLSLFWRRFNTVGVEAGIYGGLLSCLALVVLSPVMSGKVGADGENLSLLPAWIDIQVFPLENPGLAAVPIGFLCAITGTLLAPERNTARFQELQVRSLTGAGAHRVDETR